MLSYFPSTGKIIQFVSLRSQVLVSLPVKLVLYGKNCHVPCAIEGAAICPSDLSWHAGNFFRVAHDAALPATFCPAVSGWLPADRFEGESRMSCRVDETCSRMEHARKSLVVASTREPSGSLRHEQRICPWYTRGLFIPTTSKLHAVKWADILDDSLILQ